MTVYLFTKYLRFFIESRWRLFCHLYYIHSLNLLFYKKEDWLRLEMFHKSSIYRSLYKKKRNRTVTLPTKEGEKKNSYLINIYISATMLFLVTYSTVLWGHSTYLVGGYEINWSWFQLLCYYTMFIMLPMLFTHVWDEGPTTWHHWNNNIKGGSSFLFTIGNADFELNISVILSASGNPLFS